MAIYVRACAKLDMGNHDGNHDSNQVAIYAVMRIVQRHHKDIYLSVFGISTYLSGELWSFLVRRGILDFRKSVILHQTSSNKIIYAIKL